MKKIFALAVLAIASLSAAAGDFYVGGSLGYMHEGSKYSENGFSPSTNTISILPEIGYNLNEKWAVGTVIGYNYMHYCGQDRSGHMFQVSPYARYTYFRSSSNLISLFVDGGVEFGAGWSSYSDESSKTACIYGLGFRPGLSINIAENFSFVTHVGFIGYKGANNAAKASGYGTKAGVSLNSNDITFGFYYNF